MATLAAKLATLPAPATSTEAPRALGFEVTPCRIPEPGPEPTEAVTTRPPDTYRTRRP